MIIVGNLVCIFAKLAFEIAINIGEIQAIIGKVISLTHFYFANNNK